MTNYSNSASFPNSLHEIKPLIIGIRKSRAYTNFGVLRLETRTTTFSSLTRVRPCLNFQFSDRRDRNVLTLNSIIFLLLLFNCFLTLILVVRISSLVYKCLLLLVMVTLDCVVDYKFFD